MQFSDLASLARRRWLAIGICVLIGGALGAWQASQQDSVYQSTAQVFVNDSGAVGSSTAQPGALASQRAASYVELARGPAVTGRVVEELDLDLTTADLAAKIVPATTPGTAVLTVSVTDADPEEAERLAEAVATTLSDVVTELETPPDGSDPLVRAIPVGTPSAASAVPTDGSRTIALGVVVGLVVGAGVGLLLDRRRKGAGQHS